MQDNKNYIEGFHELDNETRIAYHKSAEKRGLSLDQALLNDACIYDFENSPIQPTKAQSVTLLNISSPNKPN